MIERPKPLTLVFASTPEPKATLKAMLEATDRKDRGLPVGPLGVIDPMTLDELINRIDSGALALNQVPDPKDIEKLVQYYWSMCEQFNREAELGLTVKPKSRPKKPGSSPLLPGQSVLDLLGSDLDDEEKSR